MLYATTLALFLPLAGFITLMLSSYYINRRLTGIIACSAIFISFLCFAGLLIVYTQNSLNPMTFILYKWIPVQGINADFALRLDPLTLVMTLIVTGVSFLIHVYSIGYMEHEEDFARYFAFLNFFVFMMLLLVLAANVLLLFVGWEGVGLASYLLIGYFYQRPAAAQAATKAFVVNRIGDLGFLLGILLMLHTFGTTDITEVSRRATEQFAVGAPLLTVLTLLLFIGAAGKSAQIPLHVWLPDAMEGPTPVSALIHAATMVTAGVYMIVRLYPVFTQAPDMLHVIGAIGGITSLFAALCAVGQTDLKKVLAYSTVSQLGLMFLSCGIGAFYAAMFHLTTHAFMKALLFLSAGDLIHMMRGTTDMEKMGGLYKKFPVTHWLFLIGVLAMSGIPPLAAFFSKDLILEDEYLSGYEILFGVALAASILTGFYLTRAYFLSFLGKPKLEDKILRSIKEAPLVMIWPVSILAILSTFGGLLGFAFGKTPILEGFLGEIGIDFNLLAEKGSSSMLAPETLVSVAAAILGVGSAAILYGFFADKLGRPLAILKKAFYLDEIYEFLIVNPIKKLSLLINRIIEPGFFDGIIRLIARTVDGIAYWLQHMQSGQIRSYVAWMVVGAVAMIAYFVL